MSIGVFPGAQNVLFLAPIVTADLLALHRRYHEALAIAAPQCWDYYRPGNWVPHVTLAMDVTAEVLPEALAIVAANWQAGEIGLDEMNLIEARPVRRLASYPLATA